MKFLTNSISTTLMVTLVGILSLSNVAADDREDNRFGHMGMMGGGTGGHGPGHGMGMMKSPVQMLNLSDSQRSKVNAIQDSVQKQNWKIMGDLMDESSKLRDLYGRDRPESSKILAVYDRIFALQKSLIKNSLSARNQQYDLLTDEQRKELKELRGSTGWKHGYRHRQ